jgi:hypothetical protein
VVVEEVDEVDPLDVVVEGLEPHASSRRSQESFDCPSGLGQGQDVRQGLLS